MKSERHEGLSGKVSSEVADVHDLPSDADRFHAIITTLVIAVANSQSQAVVQCLRIASAE